MKLTLIFVFSVLLIACNHSQPAPVIYATANYEEEARQWFDTCKNRNWQYFKTKVIKPNPQRYDSLERAFGLPQVLFVYLDALNMPYKPKILETKGGHKELLLNIDLSGNNWRYTISDSTKLEYFFTDNGKVINTYFNTDTIWEAVVFNYEVGGMKRNLRISDKVDGVRIFGEDKKEPLERKISRFYSDTYVTAFVAPITDSNMYVSVLDFLDKPPLSNDEKYRLVSLSPIVMAAMLKERAKKIKNIVYIQNRADAGVPPIIDTVLKVPTAAWQFLIKS